MKLNRDELEFLIVMVGWLNRILAMSLSLLIIIGIVLNNLNNIFYVFILANVAILSGLANIVNIIFSTILSKDTSKFDLSDVTGFEREDVKVEKTLSIRQRAKIKQDM